MFKLKEFLHSMYNRKLLDNKFSEADLPICKLNHGNMEAIEEAQWLANISTKRYRDLLNSEK